MRPRVNDIEMVAADCETLRLREALDHGSGTATAIYLDDASLVALGDETRAVAGECDTSGTREPMCLFFERAARDFEHAALAAVSDENHTASADRHVVELMQFGREHFHLVRHRMIGSDVAPGSGDDQGALGTLGDAAHETGEMAVEEPADTMMRAVRRNRRHADTVGGIEGSVIRDCDSHRSAKSGRNQSPLGAIGHDFADAAVDEMGNK